MRRALLLINPYSRRGGDADLSAIRERLEAEGIVVTEIDIADPAQAEAAILRHCNDVTEVIIGGGDGTLSKAAPALHRCGLPLGILPLGTANDFAHTLNIPTDPVRAASVIAVGRKRKVDLGTVNDVLFFNAANIGLGTGVTRALSAADKQRFGVVAYLRALRRALAENRTFRADIRTDGNRFCVRAVQVTVGNGRRHGGGIIIDQDAQVDDRRLHLYAVKTRSWWRLLRLAADLRRGRPGSAPDVVRASGETILVTTRPRRQVSTDGELSAWTPARFSVLPAALEVFAPESDSGGLAP